MPDVPWKILLVGGTEDETARLERALATGLPEPCTIVAGSAEDVPSDQQIEDGFDLLFVDLDGIGRNGIETVAGLRRRAPRIPVVAIGRGGEESLAFQALQAGAQDCLGSHGGGRCAADQGRPLRDGARAFPEPAGRSAGSDAREHELGGLSVLGGPSPLPITERSLGTAPLSQRAPDDFLALVRHYGELLDGILMGRVDHHPMQDVDAIADRLGMLGAGPRDAIDLHKAAMAPRLKASSARKNKAYVEEGVCSWYNSWVISYRSTGDCRGGVARHPG